MREVLKLAKSACVSVHNFENELPLLALEYDFFVSGTFVFRSYALHCR